MAPLIGIAIKLLAVCATLVVALLVKTFPDDAPISQIIFFRVTISLPFIIAFVAFQQGLKWPAMRERLTPANPWLHVRRSFFGMSSLALTFTALRLLPLPIANALKELAPIFITILAALFLGERIRIYRTSGLLMGVIGVALISYQTILDVRAEAIQGAALWGALAAIGAAFTIALAQIQIRSMVKTEHPTAIVFWFFVLSAIVSAGFAPFGWVWPSAQAWPMLLGLGAAGGVTQLSITIAYRFADASTLAPFEYMSIPLALLIGGVYFGEWPAPIALAGMGLILTGALVIIIREGQIARQGLRERELRATVKS